MNFFFKTFMTIYHVFFLTPETFLILLKARSENWNAYFRHANAQMRCASLSKKGLSNILVLSCYNFINFWVETLDNSHLERQPPTCGKVKCWKEVRTFFFFLQNQLLYFWLPANCTFPSKMEPLASDIVWVVRSPINGIYGQKNNLGWALFFKSWISTNSTFKK